MTAGNELQRFGTDLGRIASRALPDVDKVLEVGANKIKKGLNDNLAGSSSFRPASGSVTYDRQAGLGSISYVIGPDKQRRGGALGNIAFFGTSRGGGTVDLEGPLREEAPIVEGLLGDLMGKWSRSV
ncbi:hypothetical protein [Nesterenkonia jeotgali]|uniref:HK97 gp10 family phage protein n=1 Tax=Nesterenkonia jeotgali TaxID=317018 RepID=A0A839FUH8_9MICC|nr:hypothetical protein [Nesterenkonia jeotgali]MBA8920437.1 hypothetical protein [Nesterenkonia jeotgali]